MRYCIRWSFTMGFFLQFLSFSTKAFPLGQIDRMLNSTNFSGHQTL